MGDLKIQKSFSTSLPPGFRFHPTDQQIFSYYLCDKNNPNLSLPSTSNDPCLGFDVIREIDLYNYAPCDLPEIVCFPFGRGGSKKHWYCFTVNAAREGGAKRKAKGGVWKRKGRERDVLGGREGGVVLGRKTSFVFYSGNSSRLRRTNWVLVEYALVDPKQDSFVLCRIFFKSHGGNKIEKHVQNSYIEESIAATDNICTDVPYKQHDGVSTSGIGEVVVREDIFTGTANENCTIQLRLAGETDDQIVSGPVSVDKFGPSTSITQPIQLDRHSGGFKSGGIVGDDAVVDKLSTDSTILDENYIELNDLVSPLLIIDSLG